LNEPEGILFLPDGSLVVAEQGTNRLLRYDFRTRAVAKFLQLENRTNQAGVDNIFFDAQHQQLVVPDSPNGTILFVNTDGKVTRTLPAHLVRPTGVALEANGALIVADEYGNRIVRVDPETGAVSPLARLPTPDDVVVDTRGDLCAVTLGDNAVHCLLAGTGTDTIVARGLGQPQGILFDTDGNLIVAEPGYRRIVKIVVR
jgi:sugar lactone lactonase YvrE